MEESSKKVNGLLKYCAQVSNGTINKVFGIRMTNNYASYNKKAQANEFPYAFPLYTIQLINQQAF